MLKRTTAGDRSTWHSACWCSRWLASSTRPCRHIRINIHLHTKSDVQKRTRQASACVQFHVATVQNICAYVHSLVFKLQMFSIWSVQNELC